MADADAPVSRGALPQEIADAIEALVRDVPLRDEYVFQKEYQDDFYKWLHGKTDTRAHLEGLILKHIQGEK